MSKTFEQGKDEVARLCRRFAANRDEFLAQGGNEAQVRRDLIDPLFEALGWDVSNRARVEPRYREVIPAESLDAEDERKAPDYAFRVGTLTKFNAAAQPCAVDIHSHPALAFQVRRCGWNFKTGVAILTNFSAIAVYECITKPKLSDRADRFRSHYFEFHEYPERWRDLWGIFSRESVCSGRFDTYVAAKRKRGILEVDEEFLKEIEGWRLALAKNIALRNKNVSAEELNLAAQTTIDRIVFLRMAEDRGLEPFGQLLRLSDEPNGYASFLRNLCRKAEDKYNSGLFRFHSDAKDPDAANTAKPELRIDDNILKGIIERLYLSRGSPYDFRMLPVEILGTVYERFLGKVIRLDSRRQARIEPKPKAAKSSGVYYTPDYIVDSIVQKTVGAQIAGKSPSQLAGGRTKASFRVLDMACGGGAFLLGAYRLLLSHALTWYSEHDPATHKKFVHKDPHTGEWRLTIAEKQRLLTSHIFGVDIDKQAVEVTKLSLLLKSLEGENELTLAPRTKRVERPRALPNLSENIKCGNSLIGTTCFEGRPLADAEEMMRINPFDWQIEFPAAMREGGFSCVVGNPPYVRIQAMKQWAPLEVELYRELYRCGKNGSYDMYVVFIERGLSLLNADGRLGFICPNKFFNSKYGEPIRSIVAQGKHLREIVHFGAQQIFKGATAYTCLLFLGKAPASECRISKVDDLVGWRATGAATDGSVSASEITSGEWNFAVGPGAGLFAKLSGMKTKLGDVADIFVGLQTSADEVYIMDLVEETDRTYRMLSKSLGKQLTFEKKLLYPVVSGTDVSPYGTLPKRQYVLFPYAVSGERATLIEFRQIQADCPKTAAYLVENKRRLESREKGALRDSQWHRFGRSQNLGIQNRVKLCLPRLVENLHAAYDRDGSRFLDNVDVGGVTLKAAFAELGLSYLLAILNSRLMRWYFPQISAPFRGGWRSANRQFLSLLPLRAIDLQHAGDAALHERLLHLADSMTELQSQLERAQSSAQQEINRRQMDATDAEIDRIVYGLYGLTPDEVAIVELATQASIASKSAP